MVSKPIIIVGAGRSGTKLLRSVLDTASETVIFPREINYVWRYGNASYPTDILPPELARPAIQRYVHKKFEGLAQTQPNARVVEKTCANALRVPFVYAIFPDAYFIHIIRDGRAVAESARRRWSAKPELNYLLEKLRWVPARDIPYYGWRYLTYQLGRFNNQSESAQSSWGPRFDGLDELVEQKELLEVCGIQWQTCVQTAQHDFQQLPQAQTLTVHYESLIENPVGLARDIFAWADLSFTNEAKEAITHLVHDGNLSKWRNVLAPAELDNLTKIIRTTLAEYGYDD